LTQITERLKVFQNWQKNPVNILRNRLKREKCVTITWVYI